MKKTHIIGIIILLVIVGIILFNKKDTFVDTVVNPPAFSIYYEEMAMHEEWGKNTLEILEDGTGSYNKYEGLELQENYDFELSEEELAQIWQVVEKNKFFSLRDEYKDPSIMAAGSGKITITSEGQTKTVVVVNYYLLEFHEIESKILTIIKSKIGDNL